jgi:hypothetical protein
MININNSVTNILGSPAIISDVIENRPPATDVAIGTIFIATDESNIYRSDGDSWFLIGTGSGGSVNPTSQYIPYNQAGTFIDSYLFNDHNNLNLRTIYSGINKGIYLDFDNTEFYFGRDEDNNNNNVVVSTPVEIVLGDFLGNVNGTRLIIKDINQTIRTYEGGVIKGIDFRFDTETYNFGTEQYLLNFDINNSLIQTFTNGNKFGFRLSNNVAEFGAYNGNTNIIINDSASSITMGATNSTQFTFGANKLTFNGANLIATGVHTATANHLKVTINGANYTIQLLTP